MPCSLGVSVSPEQQRRWALLLGIFMVIAVVLAVVFWMILDDYGAWSEYQSSRCDTYCENSHQCNHEMSDRPVIQQPVNTWTNLAYIFVGLYPIVCLRVDVGTVAYMAANMYAGIGSFVYHASISLLWRTIDVAGMYTLFLSLVFHGVHAVTGVSWKWLALPLLALGIAFAFVKTDMDDMNLGSTNMFYILCGSIALLTSVLVGARILTIKKQEETIRMKCQKSCKVVLVALSPVILVGLAAFIRQKDADKVLCNPDGFFQGHGLWHVMTAIANVMVWLFFDSNRLADIMAPAPGQPDDDDVPSKVDVMDMTDETFDIHDNSSGGDKDGKEVVLELTDETLELQQEASENRHPL